MPTPEVLWKKLVEEAGEDAIAEAAGESISQAERDLRAAGFDVKDERAKASAWLDGLAGKAASSGVAGDPASERIAWVTLAPPAARRRSASRYVLLLAAALAAAATAGGILYAVGHRSKPQDSPVEVPREGPSPAPAPSSLEVPSAAPPAGPGKPQRMPAESKP